MTVAQPLDTGIRLALLGGQGLERGLLVADHLFALLDATIQFAPAHRLQLRLELPLLLPERLKALGRLRLTVQPLQLTLQLFAQVGKTGEILLGAADAILGLAPPLLVLGDAGGFLDVVPQILRTRLDQLGDHSLLDDRIAARAEAGTEEDVGDVAPAALGAVEKISVLAFAGHRRRMEISA